MLQNEGFKSYLLYHRGGLGKKVARELLSLTGPLTQYTARGPLSTRRVAHSMPIHLKNKKPYT